MAAAKRRGFGGAVGMGFLFDAAEGIDTGSDPTGKFGAAAKVFALIGNGVATVVAQG